MLGFGGGLYDFDTGLIHFGYREYDPVIGRFISPDPLGYDGGDVDLYGFCLDDPINFVDRDGLQNSTLAAEEKKDENSEAEERESPKDETSKSKNDSITGMDMLKERQALKEKKEKQESETEKTDAATDSVFNVGPKDQLSKEKVENKTESNNDNNSTSDKSTTNKTNTQEIPVAPEGVSVDENMAKARSFGSKVNLLPPVYRRLAKYGYLAHQFGPGRDQDYKTRGRKYEHFGNYNFGAAAKALGVSELEAKAGAGAVQTVTGTAKPKWWKTFFDDPVDQQNIANGYRHQSK